MVLRRLADHVDARRDPDGRITARGRRRRRRGRGRRGGLLAGLALGQHGREAELAAGVDLLELDLDLLAHLHNIGGAFHELVAELADVDEAVLVDADVHKRAEGGDIRHDAGQFEAGFEVLHFLDAFLKAERLKLLAWVAAGLGQLLDDVGERGQADILGDVFFQVNFGATGAVLE